MIRKDALNFLEQSDAEYVTYGLEGSDLGTPIEKEDAIADIKNMSDDTWADGEVYECDKDGYLL